MTTKLSSTGQGCQSDAVRAIRLTLPGGCRQISKGAIKSVGHAPGLYGVRRQAKRDAALASVCVASISKPASQAKAASRFACRRTPYGFDRHFESHPGASGNYVNIVPWAVPAGPGHGA